MTEKVKEPFRFKEFSIDQDKCSMKIGTDGVLLGAWADVTDANRILDIGTGTGVIAIMMTQRHPNAIVTGVEVDEDSGLQAFQNMKASPWKDRLKLELVPIQDFARNSSDTFNLIVCNPPFFSGGTLSYNQDRNSVRHTVKLPNGDLLSATKKLLAPNGKFCVILPFIEGLRFIEVAETYKLYCTKMVEVKPKINKPIERLLLQFELIPAEVEKLELIIQHEVRNDYTQDYKKLTKDFYLKM